MSARTLVAPESTRPLDPSGGGLYSEKLEIGAAGSRRTVGWLKIGPKTREQTYFVALRELTSPFGGKPDLG